MDPLRAVSSVLSLAFVATTACARSAPSAGDAPGSQPARAESSVIPYEEVERLLQVPHVQAPLELTASGDRRAAWHHWLERHRAELDARLLRGDEDSIVNLMLYGTTFTSVRRTTPQDLSAPGGQLTSNEILDRRLEDSCGDSSSQGRMSGLCSRDRSSNVAASFSPAPLLRRPAGSISRGSAPAHLKRARGTAPVSRPPTRMRARATS